MSQQQLLTQALAKLFKAYQFEVEEKSNFLDEDYTYLLNIIQDPLNEDLTANETLWLLWLEVLNRICDYRLIRLTSGLLIAVTSWKKDGELVRQGIMDSDSLINLALRNSITSRTARITRMHAEIDQVTVELEQISSLIGRI